MHRSCNSLSFYIRLGGLIVFLLSATTTLAESEYAAVISAGKKIAFDVKKGNCLSCHKMKGGESAGTVGPVLVSMRARYSNKNNLKEQIWDARINNPRTIMPPFGRHRILSNQEIDQLIEYLYTL